MNTEIENLWRKYNQLLDSQSFIEDDLDYSILKNHITYLEKIGEISNSVIMVFDMFKRQHVFVSKNISNIFKLDLDKVEGATDYLDQRIHPDDYLKLMEAGLYFLQYAFTISQDKRKDYKLINEYRLKNEKGDYIKIIEQQLCLEFDKHGNIWLSLGIMDLSPEKSDNDVFKSRLIDLKKHEVYLFPPKDKESILTARETEVLQLISKGLLSKEIADKLYISINTVNTHRQRILEKLNADNSIEAIKYANSIGLI
ncbi:MAG: LuxR C-terminal-related transcriptional regulator [Bacteroidetes bacterium]|nr:LuxR C-terminal-related transcriptional regulator [Bacteroidota bacterium]